MPKPSIPTVQTPGFQTPVQGFTQPCGFSYDLPIGVTQPYKGTDNWTVQLPARSGLIEDATTDDVPVVRQAVEAAQSQLDGQTAQLPIQLVQVDPVNAQAIQNMLGRAQAYTDTAEQLWSYWAEEWTPIVVEELPPTSGPPRGKAFIETQLRGWPLSDPVGPLPECVGQPGGQVVEVARGGWRARVMCPDVGQIRAGDKAAFTELLRAAMLWARCAEESGAAVGIHYLNRQDHEGEIGGLAQAPPGPPEPAPPIADPGPVEPPPEPPEPPGGFQPQPPGPPPPPVPPGGFEPAPEPPQPPAPEPPAPAPGPATPTPAFVAEESWFERYGGWVLGGAVALGLAFAGFQAAQARQ